MELSPLGAGSQVQALMVTDVHLAEMGDDRGQLLLQLIERAKVWKPEYFILGGDIFEFCFGSRNFFRRKFSALGTALTQLAADGTKVLFVEGNHEFDLAGLGWKGVEFITGFDRVVKFKDGSKSMLSHGDLVYGSNSYRIFRGIVKSNWVHFLAKYVVPPQLLDWYALRHSKMSRAAGRYRNLDHDALLDHMNRWISGAEGTSHGFFGHFHVPYFQPRAGNASPGFIISCESWDRPNALVMAQGKFSRLFWDRHTRDWVRQPAMELDFGEA